LKNEVSGRVRLFVEMKYPEDTEKVIKAIHEAKLKRERQLLVFMKKF
jgi:hypothetical protein